jgi:hypothetical protein
MSMRCEVCLTPRPPDAGSICPRCGWDADSPWANDTAEQLAARAAFQARLQTRGTSAPAGGDRALPWIVVGIGVAGVILVLVALRTIF